MSKQFIHLKENTGVGSFYLYSDRLVNMVALPSETKAFLQKVGIPPIDSDLINLYDDESKIKELDFRQNKYLIIGDDFGTSICVQSKTGAIYSIDQSGELFMRFVNSDIEKLLLCLDIYYENVEALREVSDDDAGDLVAFIKQKLLTIDAPCLNNEENWWSVLLEQTELGLT